MNYQRAAELFEKARNKDAGKKLANNTYLHKRGEHFAIRLHATDIITILPDDTFILNTGGWTTVTTKERINSYSPARVWSIKGLWHINGHLFRDGMIVDKEGKVLNPMPDEEKASLDANKRMEKAITKYINGFAAEVMKGDFPDPGNGDCWGCLMKDANGKDGVIARDHLIHHFEEPYYVPSLLWTAFCETYATPQGAACLWHSYIKKPNKGTPKEVKRVLRKYFKNRKATLIEYFKDGQHENESDIP